MARRMGRQCIEGQSKANNYRITYQFYILIYQPGDVLISFYFRQFALLLARKGYKLPPSPQFFRSSDADDSSSCPIASQLQLSHIQPTFSNIISTNHKHHPLKSCPKKQGNPALASLLLDTCLYCFSNLYSFWWGSGMGKTQGKTMGKGARIAAYGDYYNYDNYYASLLLFLLVCKTIIRIIQSPPKYTDVLALRWMTGIVAFSSLLGLDRWLGKDGIKTGFGRFGSQFRLNLASTIFQVREGGLSVFPSSVLDGFEVLQTSTATLSFPFRDENMEEDSEISSSPISINLKASHVPQKRQSIMSALLPQHYHPGTQSSLRYDFDFIKIRVNYFPKARQGCEGNCCEECRGGGEAGLRVGVRTDVENSAEGNDEDREDEQ